VLLKVFDYSAENVMLVKLRGAAAFRLPTAG